MASSRGRRRLLIARGLPGARQQLGDAFHRMIGQTGDEVDEVGFGINALLAAVLHQGEQRGQPGAGLRMTDVAPVLRAELQWPYALLDEIIFDPRAGFGQT